MAIRITLVLNFILSFHIVYGLSIFPFFQKQASSLTVPEESVQSALQPNEPSEICTGSDDLRQCRNTVLINNARMTRKHPNIVDIPGERTVSTSADKIVTFVIVCAM